MYNKAKLLILFAFVMLFEVDSIAQDVIFLKNGNEIMSLVQEIGLEYITYKKYENQAGPIYYVAKAEVFMIKYENGMKDIFNEDIISNNSISNDLRTKFYNIGTNDREMLIFFKENNFFNYYNSFSSACRCRNVGKALLGSGIALTGCGFIFIMCGAFIYPHNVYDAYYGYYSRGYDNVALIISGGVFLCAGEILTIVSIPVSAVAGARKKAIKNNFAREYFGAEKYTYQTSLNFGITQNGGIGLLLKF
ncbi:MAG: hypothetical protein LBU83_02980 [Bacteroidales bacterium]|jgi:hypothetical protein|nr:hypothetical protein [Bacteroidales bacterium]